MACKCATCKLSKKIQRLRPKWDKGTKSIVDELWARMEWAETSEQVLEARLKGDWPEPEWTGNSPFKREVIVKVDGKVKQRYRFVK